MEASDKTLSQEEEGDLIADFEQMGSMTFRIGEEKSQFDVIVGYVGKHAIPTYTDVDRAAGTITIMKRPWGSLEFG